MVWENRPDVKLLLENKFGNFYPILIEYKGYKDKLVKLNKQNNVFNKDENGVFQFNNIKNYAVNDASLCKCLARTHKL